jgi:signal transduction histidine kinase
LRKKTKNSSRHRKDWSGRRNWQSWGNGQRVGHELRNPLAVINNALYMLRLANKGQDATINEYLNIIDQEVASSNKIITDLLTFARIKPANLDLVKIPDLIESIFTKFIPPDNVVINNELTNDIPDIRIDKAQIGQVITNLVTNAYQAMPEGGYLTILSKLSKEFLRIDFTDTGIGIPPENLEIIFEPLFTTKAKGIGLGLTISKMLTEVNGGKIKVKSKVGIGSTFSLYLPLQGKTLDTSELK